MNDRSNRADVRNPMLAIPEVIALKDLPDNVRWALARALAGCSTAFRTRGNEAWRKHKPPMAAYWKANAVNFRHLALAVRPARGVQEGMKE